MSIRHTAAFTFCALCGAAWAQSNDLGASSRQERMDSAYANWQHRTGSTSNNSMHRSAHHNGQHAGTASNASVGESLREYGHSFMSDVKKAPHQLANAGRETGHSIAEAAREQGHDAKVTAGEAKKAVTGNGS